MTDNEYKTKFRGTGFNRHLALEKLQSVAGVSPALTTQVYENSCTRCLRSGRKCYGNQCDIEREYKAQMDAYEDIREYEERKAREIASETLSVEAPVAIHICVM